MNKILGIYERCERFPLGKWIFSRLICFQAPYFGSIKPLFRELRPGYSEVLLKKRRSVTNHLGSIHAIAMCNLAEITAGILLEASIPGHLRWIPKGMTVSYLKLAKTDVIGTCKITVDDLRPGDLHMQVSVQDRGGDDVFSAVITMYLSERKQRQNKAN